jgi:hypothetical protein
MKEYSYLTSGSVWGDPHSKYSILGYIAICVLLAVCKFGNAFPLTWTQAFLLEIAGGIAVAAYYFSQLLGSIIPDRAKTFWRIWKKLEPGATYISRQPKWYSLVISRISWAAHPFKGYCRKVTESRSRQGFWLKA